MNDKLKASEIWGNNYFDQILEESKAKLKLNHFESVSEEEMIEAYMKAHNVSREEAERMFRMEEI